MGPIPAGERSHILLYATPRVRRLLGSVLVWDTMGGLYPLERGVTPDSNPGSSSVFRGTAFSLLAEFEITLGFPSRDDSLKPVEKDQTEKLQTADSANPTLFFRESVCHEASITVYDPKSEVPKPLLLLRIDP